MTATIGPAQKTRTQRSGRSAGEWKKTACSLCYINCGLEVQIEGHRITKVRGDKDSERTKGYICQKGLRMAFYGDHADRLTTPLRRRADGSHEPITWEQAIGEIAAKLSRIRDEDMATGRAGSFALVGGGGQGNVSAGPHGHALMRWMNSTRFFTPFSQEKTGDVWVNAKLFGGDLCHTAEGVEECDVLVVLGCNPWIAHGFNRARNELNAIKNAPDRKMIVLDPRRTETAEMADVHALPHGYGMYYPDGKGGRVLNGPRINMLTDALDRDRIAGTPHYKDMPVRLERATATEVETGERDRELVKAIIEKGNERRRARA